LPSGFQILKNKSDKEAVILSGIRNDITFYSLKAGEVIQGQLLLKERLSIY
jgi:hypothetical protein